MIKERALAILGAIAVCMAIFGTINILTHSKTVVSPIAIYISRPTDLFDYYEYKVDLTTGDEELNFHYLIISPFMHTIFIDYDGKLQRISRVSDDLDSFSLRWDGDVNMYIFRDGKTRNVSFEKCKSVFDEMEEKRREIRKRFPHIFEKIQEGERGVHAEHPFSISRPKLPANFPGAFSRVLC